MSKPTVTGTTVTLITQTTATGSGNVTSAGGGTITARGVAWSTVSNKEAVTGNSKTVTGTTGVFTALITGLLPDTKYYVKAFATNSSGTNYATEASFTTLPVSVTAANYRLYERTGIGDGAAFEAEITALAVVVLAEEQADY